MSPVYSIDISSCRVLIIHCFIIIIVYIIELVRYFKWLPLLMGKWNIHRNAARS